MNTLYNRHKLQRHNVQEKKPGRRTQIYPNFTSIKLKITKFIYGMRYSRQGILARREKRRASRGPEIVENMKNIN